MLLLSAGTPIHLERVEQAYSSMMMELRCEIPENPIIVAQLIGLNAWW